MEEKEILELLETDPDCGMAVLEKQYGGPVRYAAAQRLDSADDVRQCVQDAFSDFYLHRERFDPEKGSLRAYLTAIAERKAIRRWRENRRQQLAEQLSVPDVPTLGDWETRDALRGSLDRLPEPDRQILLLRYFEGRTVREIAAVLDLDYERVKKRAQRALKKLQRFLEEALREESARMPPPNSVWKRGE